MPKKENIANLIDALRDLVPMRPLSYGESLHLARLQAALLRKLLDATEADFNLIWLVLQRTVPVSFVPAYKINGVSGITTNAVGNGVQIFINANEPTVRQRFSLLHELKHVLDFHHADTLHKRLGSGNADRQSRQIELICNEFAACVLMPPDLTKSVWLKTQDVSLAANLFNVSPEAMSTRLERLGLTGTAKPAPKTYFRRTAFDTCAA